MKTKYNLFALRLAIRELSTEIRGEGDCEVGKLYRHPFGYVEYTTRDGSVKDLALQLIDVSSDKACAIRTVDNDYAVLVSFNSPDPKELLATLAHEIGHIEAGHLNLKCDSELGFNLVDLKLDKQKLFLNKAMTGSDEEFEKNENNYNTALFMLLVRGGCLQKELEADLVALDYCDSHDLVKLHLNKTRHTNYSVRVEAMNRIVKILQEPSRALLGMSVHQFKMPDNYTETEQYKFWVQDKLNTPSKIKKAAEGCGIPNLQEIMNFEDDFNKLTLRKLKKYLHYTPNTTKV